MCIKRFAVCYSTYVPYQKHMLYCFNLRAQDDCKYRVHTPCNDITACVTQCLLSWTERKNNNLPQHIRSYVIVSKIPESPTHESDG